MRAVIQRVKSSKVIIGEDTIGYIGRGLNVLLGVGKDDKEEDVEYLVDKIINLRIFSDDEGKMNLSLSEVSGELLVVSQFTLYGSTRKGRRPSFMNAADPKKGKYFYELFIKKVKNKGVKVETGEFGAMMDVEIINDGPVTLIVESK